MSNPDDGDDELNQMDAEDYDALRWLMSRYIRSPQPLTKPDILDMRSLIKTFANARDTETLHLSDEEVSECDRECRRVMQIFASQPRKGWSYEDLPLAVRYAWAVFVLGSLCWIWVWASLGRNWIFVGR